MTCTVCGKFKILRTRLALFLAPKDFFQRTTDRHRNEFVIVPDTDYSRRRVLERPHPWELVPLRRRVLDERVIEAAEYPSQNCNDLLTDPAFRDHYFLEDEAVAVVAAQAGWWVSNRTG